MPFLKYHIIHIHILTDFRQYGQMEKQRWEELERREERKREDQRSKKEWEERRCSRAKRQKSRDSLFLSNDLVASEGRKVSSLKRRVRSHVARWETKIARRCGAKHISKSKCAKHTRFGPLLDVELSKKCTPLWREAHSKSKVQKTGVQMSFCVAGARDSACCQK